ncbi:hypothetical protein ACHWQZ_G000738 [Mnemiopsis leidyi]
MAVEEKTVKKTENTWSNPFSGRYEPFVDEKGFGKFHLFNLNSTKQISLEQAGSTNSTTNNITNNTTNNTANNSTVSEQAPSRSMGIKTATNELADNQTAGSAPSIGDNPALKKIMNDLKTGMGIKEVEEYKKLLQGGATEQPPSVTPLQSQEESEKVDPNDPLASLIKQINDLKQQTRAMEGEIITSTHPTSVSSTNSATTAAGTGTSTPAKNLDSKTNEQLELLEKLFSENKPHNNTSEQCPNVNPFPLASLLQPATNGGHVSVTQTSTSDCESGTDSQKQLLQQRLIDRIKGAVSVGQQPTAVTTLTNSPYISPIPAVRLEPSPKTGLQMKDVTTLDSDNIRLLRLLIPNFSQSGGAPPPNYTAVPVNQVTVGAASTAPSNIAYTTITNGLGQSHAVQPPPQAKPKQGGGVVMDNEKCLEMFQNIKKQISDQSVFNLTATIHQTSNESEGLILVVTRNKIDIHPQFGPIHVARVVITNKLYYKFFVLDKVVNSGQVDAKQISEVFWKLSEVSQHLLCPGFNQRYISKVEQTLGEKVDDITSSYCRLTAKLCTVWHQKDSKPGQRRNYHTRDLCCECLDLYHRLQFKTYSHTKLKQQQTQQTTWSTGQATGGTPHKREQDHVVPSNQAAKKPKLNGQLQYGSLSPNPVNNTANNNLNSTSHVTSNSTGGITEQQLKAVLSNLVNSRVVQMNKESEGDDLVDVLGEDTAPETTTPIVSSNLAAVNNIFNVTTMSALMSSAAAAAAQPNPSSTLGNIRVTSTASFKPAAGCVIASSPAVLTTELSSANILNSSANVLSPATSTVLLGENRSGSPNVEALSANSGAAPLVTPASNIPPNIRALTSTQPSFMLANGNILQQSTPSQISSPAPTPAVPSTNSKIDDILASLNELQRNVPELVGSDSSSVDEGIRNLLKQFQSSETSNASSASQNSNSVNSQATEREGIQDSALGDSADDSRSQGEDLLVIQED